MAYKFHRSNSQELLERGQERFGSKQESECLECFGGGKRWNEKCKKCNGTGKVVEKTT